MPTERSLFLFPAYSWYLPYLLAALWLCASISQVAGLEQQGRTGDEIEIRKAGSRKAPRQREKSPTDKTKGGGNNRVVRKNIRRMVRNEGEKLEGGKPGHAWKKDKGQMTWKERTQENWDSGASKVHLVRKGALC